MAGDFADISAANGRIKQAMRVYCTALMTAVVLLSSLCHCHSTSLTLHRASPVFPGADLEVVQRGDHARRQHLVGDFSLSYDIDNSRPYYTKIALGSPPQYFHVEVDMVHDLLWVNCISCTNCSHVATLNFGQNFFNASSSSSTSSVLCSENCSKCIPETNTCGYKVDYGDEGVASGGLLSDRLQIHQIGGASLNSSFSVTFGCNTYLGGLPAVRQKFDGSLGLGRGRNSVVAQLSSQGVIPRLFAHCLSGSDTGGGVLLLGEITQPDMTFTPLIPHSTSYTLEMLSVDVNGTRLPIDPKALIERDGGAGVVVDSGSILAYLLDEIYQPLIAAINSHVPEQIKPHYIDRELCYEEATGGTTVYPDVTLTFAGNARMVLHPEDYLIRRTFSDGLVEWCMGFHNVSNGQVSVLGELVLRNKLAVYDLDQQQFGWSTHLNCTSSSIEAYKRKKRSFWRSIIPTLKWLIPAAALTTFFGAIGVCVCKYTMRKAG